MYILAKNIALTGAWNKRILYKLTHYNVVMEKHTPQTLATDARKAVGLLQDCYRRMSSQARDPKVKAVLHDLLLMEEMNEVLLRSIDGRVRS